MKAAVLYGDNDLRYEEFREPELRQGTVKVRVRAAGICGSDVPRVLHGGAHFYPIVLGHEFAGDVIEIGEGVDDIRVGDRVAGVPLIPCMACDDCQTGNFSLCRHYSFIGSRQQGAFADYVVIPASNAVKYSPTVSYEQAALFEPSTVALHGIFLNGFTGGGEVAVLGAGTIGILTLQWAKLLGAKRVTVLDIDEGRLELAKKLGADICLNSGDSGCVEGAASITGGKGFDYVFDAVGAPATIQTAFDLAGNRARVCCIGTPHGQVTFTQKQWELMNRKEFTLTGSWMSYSAPFPGREWTLTAHYFSTGQLKFDENLIHERLPMAKAGEAFALYKNPSLIHGKILLVNE